MLVSVCIPTYNQPALTRRVIESVLQQQFTDYEIIVADDSSTDDIQTLIEAEYSAHKIHYFRNNPRLGSPANWNAAINKATGAYIKMLHHDDWFPDQYCLGEMVATMESHPEVDLVFGATHVCDAAGHLRWLHCPVHDIEQLRQDWRLLFPKNSIGAPSATLFRRRVRHRFDPRLKWVVDIDFYIALLRDNPRFVFIPRPLICTSTGDHTVTAGCVGKRDVELTEWLILFDRINSEGDFDRRHVKFLKKLIRRHQVRKVSELQEYGLSLRAEVWALLERLLFANRMGLLRIWPA